jgi:hypothetical protein
MQASRIEKRAILMISVGDDRPWAIAVAELAALYAKKCEAQFFLIDHLPSSAALPIGPLPDAPGRRNKLAYAAKCFFPWRYMTEHGFDRVLVLDDSCCIRPSCPDIFELVPGDAVGFTRTSSTHFASSLEMIQNVFPTADAGEFTKTRYMNGGFILYHSGMREAMSPERIVHAKNLLSAKFPQQTLLLYLLQSKETKMHEIDKSFNRTLGYQMSPRERSRLIEPDPFIEDNTYVYHITSSFKYRAQIIKRLCETLGSEWTASGSVNTIEGI